MKQSTFEEEMDISSDEDENIDFTDAHEIRATPADKEVKSLYDKWKRQRLNVQPEFQRGFVWKTPQSSSLIESALLRVPLPAVYLSEDHDGKESVIDGQQRLTSFFKFMDNEFKLTKLSVHKELIGKKYGDLSEKEQEKISECVLRVITFHKNSAPNLKFEIFKRLNSGAVKLNDQEMRNCIYRGWYNKRLRELSEDPTFREVTGFLSPDDMRMRDVEYVLRFAAFYFQGYLNYKSPMKSFMNNEMEARRNISDSEWKELQSAFKNAVSSIHSVFGKRSFRRWFLDPKSTPPAFRHEPKKFSAALFDILMWSFAREDKGAILRHADAIYEAIIHLSIADNEFIEFTTRGTSSAKAITGRFGIWRKTLAEILRHEVKQSRCFSRELKEELFVSNPTCALCGNRIDDIDDAAVDHIEQYWLGGKTIPENTRLAHRHCNNTRLRKE